MKTLTFTVLDEEFTIHRLHPDADIPKKVLSCTVFNITRTHDELSVICPSHIHVESDKNQPNWSALMVNGPLAFTETGILAAISATLAKAGISIFAISTFDTDTILIPKKSLAAAKKALIAAGHSIQTRKASKPQATPNAANPALALLQTQIPFIKKLITEKIGPATLATLKDKNAWAIAIGSLYEFLPAPVRIVIPRQSFVEFCIANLDKLIPAQAQPKKAKK